ncbi:TM235 protein, partial [Atractosteus spatula]|nr:TM235 protein [Atractosteus spatula]
MGLLSFSFLAAAIASEYWYILEVNKPNGTKSEELSSHTGLWRTCEGNNACIPLVYPFTEDTSKFSDAERYLINMQKVIIVVLPLSLVLLVFGGICGLVSSLARSCPLLVGTGAYLLLCSGITLTGVSVYISYSHMALEEIVRTVGPARMTHVHISFGWSMGLAWLSFALEVITGVLLFLGARITYLQSRQELAPAISLA